MMMIMTIMKMTIRNLRKIVDIINKTSGLWFRITVYSRHYEVLHPCDKYWELDEQILGYADGENYLDNCDNNENNVYGDIYHDNGDNDNNNVNGDDYLIWRGSIETYSPSTVALQSLNLFTC